MELGSITLHEGYNDLGSLTFDITNIEQPSNIGNTNTAANQPPKSRNLLFKIEFEDGSGVPSDYDIDIDLPGYTGTVKEITEEVLGITGKTIFSFSLGSDVVKPGSLTISDGIETFTDNGLGILYGSEGGYGSYDLTDGSVTFYNPPTFGVNIYANYLKRNIISDETAGIATGANHYNFTLAHTNILPGSFSIELDTVSLTDDGHGNITGTGGSGTINYETGALFLTGISSLIISGNFLASYKYWIAASPLLIGSGNETLDYNLNLKHHPVIPGTVSITDTVTENFADNGSGGLIGDLGGYGTVNYETGTVVLHFETSSSGYPILASYHTLNELYTLHTSADGFLSLEAPPYPVVVLKDVNNPIIRYAVSGPLEDREHEAYLELRTDLGGALYTLITDFVVQDGFLCVSDGDNHQYSVYPLIAIDSDVEAIRINEDGKILLYADDEWTESEHSLIFSSIEHPEFLDVYSDGFYETNGSTGTVTTGALNTASSVFEDFKGTVLNPEPYLLNATVSVFEPGVDRPIKTVDFNNIMPGSTDFKVVTITADPYKAADTSPTWTEIQTVSGITFSTAFREFLLGGNLTTVNQIRKAGPISYVSGFPSGSVGAEELATLQGHVDLYSINSNVDQNQLLIDANYGNIFAIANTPKNKFLEEVVDEDLPLFRAAQIHEVAVQNQKLVSNLLAGALTDLRLANPTTPEVEGSTFVSVALAQNINTCGCSDCKSGVSPFAYLMDLLKYGAAHISHNSSPGYTYGGAVSNFIDLMEDKFFQPFGSLNVDCDTLHDEFCRVRLVTEVLEKLYAFRVANGYTPPPTLIQSAALVNERQQFFTLVYKTILLQAGTSIDEVRNVHAIPASSDDKLPAVTKLANKLGIPIYIPSTSNYTTDRLWLIVGGSGNNELTAANLETVFGFRNTQRNVLTSTPVSLMETWKLAKSRDLWGGEDHPLSSYTREGVNPASDPTFKTNWQPILDPDNIGWEDFTYNTSVYSKAIWQNRKEDTDTFLDFCLTDIGNISRTSADLKSRIVKVLERNITGHVLDSNEIKLQNSMSTWVAFTVNNRKLNGINTDVILAKPTPSMFQPNTSTPKMRYNRVINVVTTMTAGVTTFTLTWPDDVIVDKLTLGYAKLISSGSATVYQTSNASLTVNSTTSTTANLTVSTGPSSGFVGGTVQFIYEVEVPIYTAEVMDPAKICEELFTVQYNYNLITTPGGLGSLTTPVPYYVWDAPGSWIADYYDKLKELEDTGLVEEADIEIVTDNLYLSLSQFKRMMQLLRQCENYLNAMFTSPRPTDDELYELASIFRTSAKTPLRDTWVKEEIKHTDGTNPIKLMLDGKYFWKSISEPVAGIWDSRLQTTAAGIPIIDPELLSKQNMLIGPDAQAYLDLYDSRVSDLATQFDTYRAEVIPFDVNGFEDILTDINPSYDLTPFADWEELLDALESNNAFDKAEATTVVWENFAITADDFITILTVKAAYENQDPNKTPSNGELEKTVRLLVSGYKRMQLYPGSGGWVDVEENGSMAFTANPVLYYNVIKMNMAPGRGNAVARAEWQQTLANWNTMQIVQPDIVPPENIINFVSTNPVYTLWNARNTDLINAYNTLATTYINNSGNSSNLLLRLQKQLDLVIQRVAISYFTPPSTPLVYYPYFEELKNKEAEGIDIRPYVEQLGFTITEYRYLANIIKVLTDAGTGSIPLLTSEYQDVINIIIAVRSRTVTFEYVLEEYTGDIQLDQDYFQFYSPSPNTFPVTDLPVYNQWRSPYNLRKAWTDKLQTRIEIEERIKDKWKDVLMEAEDRNMPLMRDALIRALTNTCEKWQDAAERLAKTYFIETKDNCCVKHTRVSFAIETLQGMYWSLETGIYDDFISNFSLHAPQFKQEWEWLGSYATWRSAMFVFLYPENLLYPTLKRKQSSAFKNLSLSLQGGKSVSPQDACDLAFKYQNYFDDVQNLELICSTNTSASVYKESVNNECCEDVIEDKFITFFFAQSKLSGKCYWNQKQYDDVSNDALTFWDEIQIPQNNFKVIGCYRLGLKSQKNNYIWLFYSYSDSSGLKLAYLKKYLGDPNSKWINGETTTLPVYNIPSTNDTTKPVNIAPCSQGTEEKDPSFIISYPDGFSNQFMNMHVAYSVTNNVFTQHTQAVHQALKYPRYGTTHVGASDYQLSFLYENDIIFFTATGQATPSSIAFYQQYPPSTPFQSIGSFQNRSAVGNFTNTIAYNANGGLVVQTARAIGNQSDLGSGNVGTLPSSNINNGFKQLSFIYPFFSEQIPFGDFKGYYAAKTNSNKLLAVKINNIWNNNVNNRAVNVLDTFKIAPDTITNLPVKSADCIDSLIQRALDTKSNLVQVMQDLPSINFPSFQSMQVNWEYLYEAYYFVPMLLALDQQSRGQFDSSLSWYRSVYDYTNNALSNRKIFYGLILEASITSTFTQASNWLLDPLNPHLIAKTRANAYTRYTLINIIECLYGYADQQFTLDTSDTVPAARKLYTTALDLLKTNEIRLSPNMCNTASTACLDTQVLPPESIWNNTNRLMQQNLQTLGNYELIEELVDEIADMLNDATEETYGEVFATAFEMIEEATPTPPSPESVSDVINESATRINDAYRYLSAFNDTTKYNAEVGNMYANSIAAISGISLENVSSPDYSGKIEWLNDQIPNNRTMLQFEFATPDGQQFLSGDLTYDPVVPTQIPFNANSNYYNAPHIIGNLQTGFPAVYTPLINFSFCTPSNPIYSALSLKGNVELYKIFNCRNIAGIVRELEIYPASIDNVSGLPVIGAYGNLSLPSINNFTPSQYRFKVLLERAKTIAQQAQQMESLFLAALEKEDAENYSQLRARQDIETSQATIKLQDLRINQANDEKGIANIQLGKAAFIQSHYNNLISSGLNSFEKQSLALMDAQLSNLDAAIQLQLFTLPYSFGTSLASGNAPGVDSGINILSLLAQSLGLQSSISNILASYERRQQDWQFQSQLAGFDISLANQQIKVAEDNIRIVTQERDISILNNTHAQDSLEFLKNKFTNAELYNFMGGVLERCYNYMLNLSTAIARTAERQLYFERQEQAGPFILDDYWETPSSGFTSGSSGQATDRRGLTGSARLLVDITRLEQHALDTNKRKLQMTKVISLSRNFPSEFQQFKETGVFNFSLTNQMFDYDFPGHYLRLINSVKTTVVGLLPVYDQVKASLTADTISYTVIGGTTFQKIPIRRLELDSVALTSANNATGVFEMQPAQGELLNPFEGMGIESRWEFKMPQFSNYVDYNNIADVLLTVEYTALDSYEYRTQVLQDLDNSLTFNRGFSFKNNFPDQWYDLGDKEAGPTSFEVTVDLKREFYPLGIQNLKLNAAENILLYFVRDDGYTNEIKGVTIIPAAGTGDPDLDTVDGKLPTDQLMSSLGSTASPVQKLKLIFDNTTPANRELFTKGYVTDILLIVPCKAELKAYPL